MKRALKAAVIFAAALIGGLQLFQIDKTNPAVDPSRTLEASVGVPADITLIFGRACNDCHSNTTRYPWYSYVQPAGWFLKSHIEEGRQHLNFSTFADYDARRRAKKLEEICEQVTSGEMPLPSYLLMHRDAILSESEKQALCDWTNSVLGQEK